MRTEPIFRMPLKGPYKPSPRHIDSFYKAIFRYGHFTQIRCQFPYGLMMNAVDTCLFLLQKFIERRIT